MPRKDRLFGIRDARFIDDIFSVWTSSKQEMSNFFDFANRFHATIKFTCEMSSERAVLFRYRSFQRTTFRVEQTTRCPNTFQSYRKAPIHAFLFVPPPQRLKRCCINSFLNFNSKKVEL